MPLISWNDSYRVGVAEMDTQHQKLVGLINNFHDAMKNGKGKDVIGKVLNDLKSYTVFHFGAEEKLMAMYAYPNLDKQKNEHKNFVDKVAVFVDDLAAGKTTSVTLDVSAFLKDWLLNHILKSDMQYKSYFESKGVK